MAENTTTRTEKKPKANTGTLTQLYLGLLFLATTLYAAYATIKGTDDGTGAFGAAVASLPGLIAATLLTSASIVQAAGSRFGGAVQRLLAGLGVGLGFGLVAGIGIRLAYGSERSITVLAITVAAASVLGGAAAVLPTTVLEAGLWATTWVFFAGVILGVLQPNLLGLLGGGPNAAVGAQVTAAARLPLIQSGLTGLIAAHFAYRTVRADKPSQLWYLVAGAFPGLLLLAAEALTAIGGSSLLSVVKGTSGAAALSGLTDSARVKHAVIVLVVGGLMTVIAGLRVAPDTKDAAS